MIFSTTPVLKDIFTNAKIANIIIRTKRKAKKTQTKKSG